VGTEIERKFLVKDTNFLMTYPHRAYNVAQYYIDDMNMRIRFVDHSEGSLKTYLTIKSNKSSLKREEIEFEIPFKSADDIIELKKREVWLINKTRHLVIYDTGIWEIDFFQRENEGLILAEIELNSEDQEIELPKWLGKEVTGIDRYYNANLAKFPYCDWDEDEKNGNK